MQADHSETIVLCHGYADCGLSWYYAMGGLTDNHELILLDARGHGLSDPPSAETPPDAQAEDIAGVIAALGLVNMCQADRDGPLHGLRGRDVVRRTPSEPTFPVR